MKKIISLVTIFATAVSFSMIPMPATASATTATVFLTTTGTHTWTVPANFGTPNTIEVIGGGGNGATGSNGGGGGGGGGYSSKTNVTLTPGSSVSYNVGAAAGDTYFCNSTSHCLYLSDSNVQVSANGGESGHGDGSKGDGGSTYNAIGATKRAGGDGADHSSNKGGGGGGAAGKNAAGNNASGTSGGQGDGTFGGLGATTQSANNGNPGFDGTEYDLTHGSGGGGSGSTGNDKSGGTGGLYGAAGGGARGSGIGGAGRQGLIVITYTIASKSDQATLIVNNPSPVVYGTSYTLTTNGGSGTGAVTFDAGVSTGCAVTGSTLSVTNASGVCDVTATKAADANYNSITSDPISITINKANQTISFTSTVPSNATVGGATYTPTATGGASGNAVVFTIDSTASSVCSISAGVVSFTAAGTCVIDANQTGNTNYNAAPQVQQSFTVIPAPDTTPPAYTWNLPAINSVYRDGQPISVDADITETGSGIEDGASCNPAIHFPVGSFTGTVTYSESTGKCAGTITLNNPSYLNDGTHHITLSVADRAGNSAISADRNILIDNTAPTLTSYTVSETIISPNGDGTKDDTSIDVAYSEQVQADINILDSGGNKVRDLYSSTAVTNPSPKIWDGKNNSDHVVADGVYTIQVLGTDVAGNTVSDTTKTVQVDTVAPVITLNGNAEVSVTVNNSYSDAGATALDNGTVDLTSSIITVNPVDVNTLGTYTITYNVTDAAGNEASQVTRTVHVVASATVSVTGVTLNEHNATLTVGGADDQLTATVAPENATNKNVTWSSDNTSAATVSDGGLVHAVASGSAIITVTTADGGKTDTDALTINPASSSGGGDGGSESGGTCPTACGYNGGTVPDGNGGTKTCEPTAACPVAPEESCPTACGYNGGTVADGQGGQKTCSATSVCENTSDQTTDNGSGGGGGNTGGGGHRSGSRHHSGGEVLGAFTSIYGSSSGSDWQRQLLLIMQQLLTLLQTYQGTLH